MEDSDSRYEHAKKILKNELLRGAFNTFLYLPTFMRTLYLNHTNGKFYEIQSYGQCHPDKLYQPIYRCSVGELIVPVASKLKFINCRSFLDSAQFIDISCFFRSDVYISYLFIVELNRFLTKPIDDWYDASEFLKKLKNTAGYKEYLCWLDLYKCSKGDTMYEMRLKYFRPNQFNSINIPFQENRRMLLKTIASNVAKYWYPRAILSHESEASASYQFNRNLSYFYVDNMDNDELRRNLVDIISYEHLSGHTFKEFLISRRKQDHIKYLSFLTDSMEFYDAFSSDSVDALWAKRSAMKMVSKYLMPGNSQSIKIPDEILHSIAKSTDPPYDDLFDSSIEFCLHYILSSCRSYMLDGLVAFDQISEQSYQPSPEPSIEGSIYDSMESEEEEESSIYTSDDESVESEGPRNEFINNILKHRSEYERFKAFLNSITEKKEDVISPLTDMECYIDIEKFKLTSPLEKPILRDDLACKIKRDYLTKKYFFGPYSPANRTIQLNLLGGSGQKLPPRPSSPVLLQVQKHVLHRLTNKWLKQYRDSEEFQKRLAKSGSALQKRSSVVKTNNQFVFMDTKQGSSHELFQLRKALLDPVKCAPFKRYARAKNERHARDIEFWIEVQKYKGIQHRHCSQSIIKKKIDAIIECFLDSSIPPRIQVNVPVNAVTKTCESRYELGPYIFRIPQAIVNKSLLTLWNEYNAWCEKYKDQPLPFKKLELDTQKKRLVKQLLKDKQRDEEKERMQLDSVQSQRAPSRHHNGSIASSTSESLTMNRIPARKPLSRTGSSASVMTDTLRPVLERIEAPPVVIHWKYSETITLELSEKEKRRQFLLKDILDKGMFKDDENFREYISDRIYKEKPATAPESIRSKTSSSKGQSSNMKGSFDSTTSSFGSKRSLLHPAQSRHNFDRTKLVSIREKVAIPAKVLRRRPALTVKKSTFRKFSKDSNESFLTSNTLPSANSMGSKVS